MFRLVGSDTKAVASDRAAKLAAIPGRTATLEVHFCASLGSARRRQGMKNDFTRTHSRTAGSHHVSDADRARALGQATGAAGDEYAHARIAGSELYWMDGSHVAFALEAADTAPAYVVSWLRNDS